MQGAVYIFDYAINEREAIKMLSERHYDLIILDIIIPEGIYYKNKEPDHSVGIRVARAIREKLKLNTPILVMSVINNGEMKKELQELGIQKILSKGRIMPSELKTIVDSLLR
jgi:DNA-binding NarL/FixJ family response regulator